eukprot:1759222-Rhodomonas_salina.2
MRHVRHYALESEGIFVYLFVQGGVGVEECDNILSIDPCDILQGLHAGLKRNRRPICFRYPLARRLHEGGPSLAVFVRYRQDMHHVVPDHQAHVPSRHKPVLVILLRHIEHCLDAIACNVPQFADRLVLHISSDHVVTPVYRPVVS